MLSISLFAALLSSPFQARLQGLGPVQPLPISGAIHELRFVLDPTTGLVHRAPSGPHPPSLGLGPAGVIYDNTCPTGYFLPQLSPTQLGVPHSMATGDWGGVPNQLFTGIPGQCSPGCRSIYDVSELTVGYCTSRGTPVSMVLHFWNGPQSSCMGPTLIGSTEPPAVPTTASFTLTGLPRSATPVPTPLAACYAVTVDLGPTSFPLSGGPDFAPFATMGDRFAWSLQITTTNGGDGPILAGSQTLSDPCDFCSGTLWAQDPTPADPGVGFGQDNHIFVESYGSPFAPTSDCVTLDPSGNPWSGQYLEVYSDQACATTIGVAFCDASDGSLASCPCGNPGLPNTGCDNAQGTGGVGLDVLAQQTSPTNSVTLSGFGFPIGGSPTAIVMRSNMIDPSAPVVFGDGLLCIGPSPIVRLGATLAAGGSTTHVLGHNSAMSGTGNFFYQIWYRNQPAAFCNFLATGTRAYNSSNARWLIWSQ